MVNNVSREERRARAKAEEKRLAEERKAAKIEFMKTEVYKAAARAEFKTRYYSDPEFRERTLAANRKWNEAHPEVIREAQRKAYAANPEKFKEILRRYQKTPEGKAASARACHRRRDAEKKTRCDLTDGQWKVIIEEQGNRCAHCGREFTEDLKPTRDHIVPVSKGGGLTYENVQALCQSCNSRKHDRPEEELDYLKKIVTTTVTVTTITQWIPE